MQEFQMKEYFKLRCLYKNINVLCSACVITLESVLVLPGGGGGVLPRILVGGVPRRFVNPNPKD